MPDVEFNYIAHEALIKRLDSMFPAKNFKPSQSEAEIRDYCGRRHVVETLQLLLQRQIEEGKNKVL